MQPAPRLLVNGSNECEHLGVTVLWDALSGDFLKAAVGARRLLVATPDVSPVEPDGDGRPSVWRGFNLTLTEVVKMRLLRSELRFQSFRGREHVRAQGPSRRAGGRRPAGRPA